jgi:hypothetical protein
MRRLKEALLPVGMVTLALFALSGCSATPIGAAVGLIGMAVNDADVKSKSNELLGSSAFRCDQVLGPPMEVYESQHPLRHWRVYAVEGDIIGNYRYVVEFDRDRAISLSKAQRTSDAIVDATTYAYFREKCLGQSSETCQVNIGHGPPALSVRNVTTGQLVELYDARVVKDLQKPYYAVLRFGPDGTCSEVRVATVAASTRDEPIAR